MSNEQKFTDEQYQIDYEQKKAGMESFLGEMHGFVGHAIIPFSIGGAVDMYYFPNHITGTGFATMELLDPEGKGPVRNMFGTYELLAFTKEPINDIMEEKAPTAFNLIERRICGIFTAIGNYSYQVALNPQETCEIPSDGEENKCLVFDIYQPNKKGPLFNIGNRSHHFLLCIEIFRSEMDYARAKGSVALFKKLKKAGHYPYSDLDRKPIV